MCECVRVCVSLDEGLGKFVVCTPIPVSRSIGRVFQDTMCVRVCVCEYAHLMRKEVTYQVLGRILGSTTIPVSELSPRKVPSPCRSFCVSVCHRAKDKREHSVTCPQYTVHPWILGTLPPSFSCPTPGPTDLNLGPL